jgi:hypothetical protein
MFDPWVALGNVAQATTTITMGTAVTPVPRRRPQKIARETTTVDRLSGGRFVFGVASGQGAPEFDNMGENTVHKERGATWWLEPIAPYRNDEAFAEPWNTEKLRERVLQGPPGV